MKIIITINDKNQFKVHEFWKWLKNMVRRTAIMRCIDVEVKRG